MNGEAVDQVACLVFSCTVVLLLVENCACLFCIIIQMSPSITNSTKTL